MISMLGRQSTRFFQSPARTEVHSLLLVRVPQILEYFIELPGHRHGIIRRQQAGDRR
uniref:Uncharacterized protein n=1 Tax=Arundo donax TaxID=35708 RepID=A0A0A9H6D4_ARUDO